MSSFGGSGWPPASQNPAASPFASNAFSSASKPASSSPNPFGAKPAATAPQNNGGGVLRNPFAATPPTSSTSHSNPFAKKPASDVPAPKNPFETGGPTGKSSPSIFGAKNTGGTFGATSQPRNERSPSPFGMPSNKDRANNSAHAPRPDRLSAPTSRPHTSSKPSFGGHQTFGKRFGAASDVEEHSGSDASTSSKRAKRAQRPGGTINDPKTKANGTKEGALQEGAKRNSRSAFSGQEVPKGPKVSAPNGFGAGTTGKAHFRQPPNGAPRPGSRTNASAPSRNPTPATMKAKGRESANMDDPYAKKIMDQLAQDGIHPPTWPSQPGNPSNKNVMMTFREQYKEYRDRVRVSLMKAGLIDDPEDRKRLEDALDFKGICEDMSPEYENLTRITEFDVKQAEKDPDNSWPEPSRMVKKLARSAAGQEAPLPMDVRSVPALRRTLDYLIDDLLQSDENLPNVHGFLWDRTRAIRRDFAFFSTMSPEEMRDQVYCLETIARFHVTSLHLLSQKDLKPEDFSEQQEVEQLGKTLISLMYAYNDCNAQGITCENEGEFRAYQLVFRAYHSDVLETVQREWDSKLWRESDDIRTAVSLVEALQNTQDFHGPLKGGPSFAAASTYNSYFRIVEDPSVSFTMACFSEIHFGQLRRGILSAVKKAYSRPKQTAKDITAPVLNTYLRFDTVEEAIEFAEHHGLSFSPDDDDPDNIEKSYVVLEYGKALEYERLRHTFSETIVESKRSTHTLPEVIHGTVFGDLSTARERPKNAETRRLSFAPDSSYSQPTNKQPSSAPAETGVANNPSLAPGSGPMPTSAAKPQSTFGSPTTGAQPAATPGFPPKPFSTSPFGSQPTASAPSQPPAQSSFAQPSAAPSTAFKFGQSTTPATQQPMPTPPASGFFPKATEPVQAPIPALSASASSSATDKAATSTFNFLNPATSNAGGSPAINITPPTPGLSQPSTTAPVSKPTAAPPASQAPTFFPTPPSTQAPAGSQTTSATPPVSQPFTTGTSTAPLVQKPSDVSPGPKRDRLADFVKWYVTGDEGLLEQFKIYVIEEAVRKVYEQHVKDEHERKRKEEDEKSWAEARKFRKYNLRVKYFYRWREVSRQNRASALRRSGRDQVRAYQEAKRAERLRRQKRAARLQNQLGEEGAAADNVEDLKGLIRKRSHNKQEAEDALLASGVLSGVRNEHDVAARIVGKDTSSPSGVSSPGGMSPPPPRKVNLPGFMHRINTGLGESVNKMKTAGGGAKTRALREEFSSSGLRRGLARSASRSSLPPSSEGSPASRVSGRWRLKAMGLSTMPDGSVLPDSLARSIVRDGKRYPELGDFGIDRARRASDVGARPTTMSGILSPDTARRTSHRPHASASSFIGDTTHKRKRQSEGTEASEEGEEVRDGKRILLDTERTIREMRRLREEMEEDTGWFREQTERLQGSRTGTPGSLGGWTAPG